jgi:hypothetical protein
MRRLGLAATLAAVIDPRQELDARDAGGELTREAYRQRRADLQGSEA